MEIEAIKSKHETLKKWPYKWTALERGYTDKVLHINLSENQITEKTVPPVVKEKFIGGRGYGLRYLWDATKPTPNGTTLRMRLLFHPVPSEVSRNTQERESQSAFPSRRKQTL